MILSGVQYDVLRRLAEDASASIFRERDRYFFSYGGAKNYVPCSVRTVNSLIERGLLAEADGGWLGTVYVITNAGHEALAKSQAKGRPLTNREQDLLHHLAKGATLEMETYNHTFYVTGCSIRPPRKTVHSLKQQDYISGTDNVGYSITDAGREALAQSQKKAAPLTKKQRFILAYMQKHDIAYFIWESPPRTYQLLERLETEGYVARFALPDDLRRQPMSKAYVLSILHDVGEIRRKSGRVFVMSAGCPESLTRTDRRAETHKHTWDGGHAWSITQAGREKRISDKITQEAEYQALEAELLTVEAALQQHLQSLEGRIEELQVMPYNEYLQTPEWKYRRRKAIERADYCCERCATYDPYTLHVHHKTYERRGNEAPDDLAVLCADCHAKIHDIRP